MNKYIYVQAMKYTRGLVRVYCTHSQTLKIIYDELKSLIPSANINFRYSNLDDKVTGADFDKLNGKDREAAVWLHHFLCENGFEPFAVDQEELGFVHYRKKIAPQDGNF